MNRLLQNLAHVRMAEQHTWNDRC